MPQTLSAELPSCPGSSYAETALPACLGYNRSDIVARETREAREKWKRNSEGLISRLRNAFLVLASRS